MDFLIDLLMDVIGDVFGWLIGSPRVPRVIRALLVTLLIAGLGVLLIAVGVSMLRQGDSAIGGWSIIGAGALMLLAWLLLLRSIFRGR